MTTKEISDAALDARARRAARRAGLIATRTRWRANSIDNMGGFALINPYGNYIVCDSRFDMSAEEVIEYCRSDADAGRAG